MANRRRSDRAGRDQAKDRGAKTSSRQPRQESSMQAQPRRDDAAPAQEATTQPKMPLREDVALRAYDLYQRRGGGDGGDLDDWLQAERDLQQGG